MITIIFAPPRTGKTVLMTHLGNLAMYDYERNKSMRQEINEKNNNGFCLSVPKHCLSANYEVFGRKFGYSRRSSYFINPYRLGFANKYVETHFTIPYGMYCITEAQKYFNSRMSMYYPDWQSRWMEQHGHNYIDIYMDTQRPMLIDVNIRELACFIEIINLEKHYDIFGKINKLVWTIRKIENSSLFDKYMASGKTDKSCYIQEKVVADYNVFDCYDSRNCKPKFYDGHFNDNFDMQEAKPTEQTLEGYINYLKENDDELPNNFYIRRTAK